MRFESSISLISILSNILLSGLLMHVLLRSNLFPFFHKNYLNRGYVPPEEKLEELSEEEIMKQLEE